MIDKEMESFKGIVLVRTNHNYYKAHLLPFDQIVTAPLTSA